MPYTSSRKKALCDRYSDLLQGYEPKIIASTVSYSDCSQRIILATSEGSIIEQSWSDLEMRFSATARKNALVQTGREITGSR